MTENENIRIADESLDNAISVYKTTIKVVEESKDSDYCPILDKVTVALLEELKSYRAIGTIEDFKALKEKNVAKKPILNNPKINEFYIKEAKLCPSCHSYINNYSGDYCRDCGQKLDWSE